MQVVKVPQLAWYGPKNFEISLPDNWEVEVPYMQGYNRPELKPEEIRLALQHPVSTKPLRELAKGKKQVVIVFDDLTRITRAGKIANIVIEELKAGGIEDKNIRFICSLGLHGVMSRTDFVKKLSEEIVSKYPVYNHNAFGNCSYVGTTDTFKTKVYINEEYLKCDLKIAIGSCVPHPVAGFGGGSKLIMPGIAGFESVNWHHKIGGARLDPLNPEAKPTQGMSIIEGNRFRKDIDEATGLAGIDFLINTIVNMWGESVSIHAGDYQQSFLAAAKEGKTNYRTRKVLDKDVVISNSYAKASESMISLAAAIPSVRKEGGDVVVIANAPEGQVVHYLVGMFGKDTYACQYTQCTIPTNVNSVIAFTEYPHRGSSWFQEHDKIIHMHNWQEVAASLQKTHGAGTKVAVIPDATIQYFDWFD
jgi:nickel-dependent lactate racemase